MVESPSVGEGRPLTAQDAIADLVAHGTLDTQQADAVLDALEPLLTPAEVPDVVPTAHAERPTVRVGVRRHAAEIAGYVGAVFVGLSAVVFLAQSWDTLAPSIRALILAVIAVVAGAIGAIVVGGRRVDVTSAADAARRRVAGTLFAAAAVAATLAVGVALDSVISEDDRWVTLVALTGLVLAAAGYWLAPTALGHLAVLAALLTSVGTGQAWVRTETGLLMGLAVLAVGVAWFLLTRRGILREQNLGLALAALAAFGGAQLVQTGDPARVSTAALVTSYVLTAVVAAACFAGYAVLQRWPLLVVGVAATTTVVVEMLYQWLGDSIGTPGLLLAAGLTLLAASLLGLRMGRGRPPEPPPSEDQPRVRG